MSYIPPVKGVLPTMGDNCFIAPNATIVGDVVMGDDCSIWFNAVIRGDVNSIRMFNLSFGGRVIDTPGIRELGLVDISKQELSHYFPEMRLLINECQFNNCMHINEPGCAVKTAVNEGTVHPERYYSYLNILESIEKKPY